MNELIAIEKLGDITFGMPADIELLNSPWGFYEFLGVPRKASNEDIKKAFRRLSKRLHPDHGGNEEYFKALKGVAEILLDDGSDVGPDYSQRRHYDIVSAIDEYFDGFIEYKDERTRKFSEIMLIRMQAQRNEAEFDRKYSQISPEYAELNRKYRRARSSESRKKIEKKIRILVAEISGMSPETIKQREGIIEKYNEDFNNEQQKFSESFSRHHHDYSSRIFDIFHRGKGNVTFGANPMFKFRAIADISKKYIIEFVVIDDCYFSGFSQAHFKAENANVTITNPYLNGIFHVINGNIVINYTTTSYGNVIRARAPNIKLLQGFERRGDLYVPERFAKRNWWRRKPAVDIAVYNGEISLQLQSQCFDYDPYTYKKIKDYSQIIQPYEYYIKF